MTKRILFVGRNSNERDSAIAMLNQVYELSVVDTTSACLSQIEHFRPHVLLLDVDALPTEPAELCRAVKARPAGYAVQVVLLGVRRPKAQQFAWYEAGVDGYLVRPFEQDELLAKMGVHYRLANALYEATVLSAQVQSYSSELERLVSSRTTALEAAQDMIVFALARLADSRDRETGEHLERMRIYTQILAKRLSESGPYVDEIGVDFLEDLYRASPLHDVGKVGIPDSILLKPGKLTAEEFDQMKRHTVIGAETLADAARHVGGVSFLRMAADIARFHHERFDGSGYPSGLSGTAIPLSARIVAVADVYDALTSERVYKKAIAPDAAKAYIIDQSGKHFDPAVIMAFQARFDEFLKVPSIIAGGNPASSSELLGTQSIPASLASHACSKAKYIVTGGDILVAMRESTMADNVVEWLQAAGHSVRRVKDGQAVLDEVRDFCPQILMAEWDLPGMSGIAIADRIRRERLPHYLYTILMTPKPTREQVDAALEAGVDDLLLTPAKEEELLSRIRCGTKMLRLLHELSKRPRPDPLTGVSTRLLLDDQLTREWRRARRYRMALSCVVIDIDCFGKLNEDRGTKAGDAVLTTVAGVLRDNCRATDYLFRRGADSFCVVLAETSEDGAAVWADRLRVAIAGQTHHLDQATFNITASFGIAQVLASHSSIDSVIDLAEQTQLVAKQLGGNRIVRFAALGDVNRLQVGAAQEVREPFRGMTSRDIMTWPIECVREFDSMRAASEFLLRLRINSAPVVDDKGRLVGIVSEKDLMKAMASDKMWHHSVQEVMNRDVIAFDETSSAHSIYKFLLSSPIRRIVVVNGTNPTGVISRGSLLRQFNAWCESPAASEHVERTEGLPPNVINELRLQDIPMILTAH